MAERALGLAPLPVPQLEPRAARATVRRPAAGRLLVARRGRRLHRALLRGHCGAGPHRCARRRDPAGGRGRRVPARDLARHRRRLQRGGGDRALPGAGGPGARGRAARTDRAGALERLPQSGRPPSRRGARGRVGRVRLPDRRGPARGGPPGVSLGGPSPPVPSPLPWPRHVLVDGADGRARPDARGAARRARAAQPARDRGGRWPRDQSTVLRGARGGAARPRRGDRGAPPPARRRSRRPADPGRRGRRRLHPRGRRLRGARRPLGAGGARPRSAAPGADVGADPRPRSRREVRHQRDLGHRLPPRLRLDPPAGPRRARRADPPARRHLVPGALLPRAAVAAHPEIIRALRGRPRCRPPGGVHRVAGRHPGARPDLRRP